MSKLSKDEVLHKLYYNVETGFGSVNELYKQANKEGLGLTLDEARTFMKKQPIKQEKGYSKYNSFSAPFARYEYQLDIMDMISLMKATGTSDLSSPRYGLICIDIFSKKLHIEPMKVRDGETVYKAILQCFKVLGHPMSIYTDDDGAFAFKKLQEYLKGEAIRSIITLTHANVAERSIRTVKKMLGDRIKATDRTWTSLLSAVLTKYNQQMKHGTTKLTPDEAHKDENAVTAKANSLMKEKYLRKYPKLNVGDKVKIYNKGKGNYTSRKETTSKWSQSTYKITNVGRDMMLNKYYEIEGNTKKYNRHELLLINE